MRLDARRSLDDLYTEWGDCTKCELGVRRIEVSGQFVPGEGSPRGIMLIGEGPGRHEEQTGHPFIGRSGQLLRRFLQKLNMEESCYVTNIVGCRSCALDLDKQGDPIFTRGPGGPVPKYVDRPPNPKQIEACLPKLYEEIYLVDPLLIVSLGGVATSVLMRKPVSILREAGHETTIEIPGVAQRPVFTDKKRVWAHNVRGVKVTPTERNQVRYLCIPMYHPAYVIRSSADLQKDNPFQQLFSHLKMAIRTYVKLAEYYNIRVRAEVVQSLTQEIEQGDGYDDTED